MKDDNNVDDPVINKLLKFVLLNKVVDVAFKLFIDNAVDVENDVKVVLLQ